MPRTLSSGGGDSTAVAVPVGARSPCCIPVLPAAREGCPSRVCHGFPAEASPGHHRIAQENRNPHGRGFGAGVPAQAAGPRPCQAARTGSGLATGAAVVAPGKRASGRISETGGGGGCRRRRRGGG